MASTAPRDASSTGDDISKLAEQSSPGFLSEFWYFLVHNKKWWLAPIVGVLLLVGVIMVLSSSVIAPFIYPVF